MKTLLTGGAGFIGSHLVERLLSRGDEVVVVDDLNDFYDPALKKKNLSDVRKTGDFRFVERDLRKGVEDLLPVDRIIHLAARPGVRPSIHQAELYHDVNVNASLSLFEAARKTGTPRIIFASSSTVYGNHPVIPFPEDASPLKPISPYGATKVAGENYLRVYSELHGIQATILRFFNAYGPRQRPDMAVSIFADRIRTGQEITLFGDGSIERDYTYIEDILQGIEGALDHPENFAVYNLGESRTIPISHLIELLEENLGKKATIEYQPGHPADVKKMCASIDRARRNLGYDPQVPIEEGIRRFVSSLKSA